MYRISCIGNYKTEVSFVDPGEEIYAGMIIVDKTKPGDLVVNIVEANN